MVALSRPENARCTTHILIGLVYHPPNGDNYACSNYIIKTFDSVLKRHPSAGTILLGDFNKLNDRSLISFPLRQLVKASTRGHSILAKIYSNIQNDYHQMVNSFNDLTLSLLDEFLPPKVVKCHTNDRPWVIDQLRSLFRRHQAV